MFRLFTYEYVADVTKDYPGWLLMVIINVMVTCGCLLVLMHTYGY